MEGESVDLSERYFRPAHGPRKAMDEADARDEIVRLEALIEALTAEIENCRKLTLLARLAMAVGGVLIVVTAIGLIDSATTAIAAIAALIGGIVLFGSNNSTLASGNTSVKVSAKVRRLSSMSRLARALKSEDSDQ